MQKHNHLIKAQMCNVISGKIILIIEKNETSDTLDTPPSEYNSYIPTKTSILFFLQYFCFFY